MDKFTARWVAPFYMRCLKTGLEGCDPRTVDAACGKIDGKIVDRLLSAAGWRERLVGSWFCGLKGWNQYGSAIGEALLASELVFAGKGYCFALACFADETSVKCLTQYLDAYLAQREKLYDQNWAMPALMWIDQQNGTAFAAPYIAPGGLWESFSAGKNEAWQLEPAREKFWRLMHHAR